MNKTPSEVAAVVGNIDPDAYAASTVATNEYIPMKYFRRFMAIVQVGDIVSTGTVDAKLISYTNGSGSGAADIPGAAITQMTQAGSDSNKQAVINFNTDLLAGTSATHFKLSVTMGTAGADLSAVVLGFDPRYAPASDNDATTVDEIVTV
jgi:hypothetical protein